MFAVVSKYFHFVSGKEKITDYLGKSLRFFKVADFKNLVSEYFVDIPYSKIEDGVRKRKLQLTSKNISLCILSEVQKSKWSAEQMLNTAFELEFEYVIKYHKRFEWTSHKFLGNSSHKEIPDLATEIRRVIRNRKEDALVLVKEGDELFWVSIVMKKLKTVGLYSKPSYLAISGNGRYFFTKPNTSEEAIDDITASLGYAKKKKIKLTGRSIESLLKLLLRRENVDMTNRPVYKGGTATESGYGFDFTKKQSFKDYFAECMGGDLDIEMQHYTITAADTNWLGDDSERLRNMKFRSSMSLSGNVTRIIEQLPKASMIKPPFPDFYKNFSVQARTRVRVTTSDNSF